MRADYTQTVLVRWICLNIFLLLRPNVGQKGVGGKEQTYLKHHGMFMVEEQAGDTGKRIADISCFRRAAHVVPTDVWERRYWLNPYIDLETYNDVYDSRA